MRDIGLRIREARVKLRMSQTTLAEKLQLEGIIIEKNSVSRTESGTRFIPDYELPIYSQILGVSVEWLLGIEK